MLFRVFTALVAFLANVTFPPLQDQGFTFLGDAAIRSGTPSRATTPGWYHGIASQGYIYGAGGRNNLAFFPLYPMLMRAGGRLLGGRQEDYYFAGIVVSWLAFAAAMVMLYRLARLDLDGRAALRAVMYAAVFPVRVLLRDGLFGEPVSAARWSTAAYALRTKRWAAGGRWRAR